MGNHERPGRRTYKSWGALCTRWQGWGTNKSSRERPCPEKGSDERPTQTDNSTICKCAGQIARPATQDVGTKKGSQERPAQAPRDQGPRPMIGGRRCRPAKNGKARETREAYLQVGLSLRGGRANICTQQAQVSAPRPLPRPMLPEDQHGAPARGLRPDLDRSLRCICPRPARCSALEQPTSCSLVATALPMEYIHAHERIGHIKFNTYARVRFAYHRI